MNVFAFMPAGWSNYAGCGHYRKYVSTAGEGGGRVVSGVCLWCQEFKFEFRSIPDAMKLKVRQADLFRNQGYAFKNIVKMLSRVLMAKNI